MENQFKQQNEAKYGQKDDDVIARAYREGTTIGNIWCLKNAEKYMRRFISNSTKGNNILDLKKAQDYINRAVEYNETLKSVNRKEVIEKEILDQKYFDNKQEY